MLDLMESLDWTVQEEMLVKSVRFLKSKIPNYLKLEIYY